MTQNDNLQSNADGKEKITEATDANLLEDSIVETSTSSKSEKEGEKNIESSPEKETVVTGTNKVNDPVQDDSTTHEDAMVDEKTTTDNAQDSIVDMDEEDNDDATETDAEDDDAAASGTNTNAIPEKDYSLLDLPALTDELRHLMQEYPINSFRNQAEEIKKEFESKDQALEASQLQKFKEGNPPSEDELAPVFEYDDKLRRDFTELHRLYRKQKGQFQRDKRKQEEDNLATRRDIIEQMKSLISEEENIGTTFKKFNNLQQAWKTTGKIPHDAYNITWEDYRLAAQNFYDYIDLSKELRDKDFERNLDFKKKIIARAVELGDVDDIHKALRELQELHRMWKEDAGPVAQEHRDPVWDEFSAATKVIHDKRQAYYEERDKMAEKNQTIKQNIIAEFKKITAEGAKSHKEWQDRLEEINVLKELFKKTGPAPKEVNNSLWESYREVSRDFNKAKNNFYKSIKEEQSNNLAAKMKLVEIAESHQDSENFGESLEVMKKIQAQWKTIGHVPRKDSDKIWKRFQKACNAFFDKKTAQKKEANKEELVAYEEKLQVYNSLKEMLPQDDVEAVKADIEKVMDQWSAIGRVPYAKRQIQEKFEKLIKAKLKAAGLNEVDAEMLKYQNKLNSLENGDQRDFKNERFYLRKRRDEIQDEMRQLENNLQFINAKDDKNPFLVQQRKNIAAFEKELDVIKEKQKQLNILQRQLEKDTAPEETEETEN
jgi:hypothetical protein